ncbi:MAG: adenylate cyclase, partial [Clostridiales bacterium]|nr:adenylate cyclase [Clostridiales bacterium]
DALGSIIIGAVSGFLVVFGVWLLDHKLHIDDPVGAVAVHGLNGIWGTLAVGLFASPTSPTIRDGLADVGLGLFYGGGFKQLGIQALGVVSVGAYTAVLIFLTFLIIKACCGLRVSEEEEIVGLDATEHGLPSAYAGFSLMDVSNSMIMDVNENTDLGESDYDAASAAQRDAAVQVIETPSYTPSGIYRVDIIAKQSRYEELRQAMNDLGVSGMTVTQVMGCGVQKGAGVKYRGVELDSTLLPKVKVEVVVCKIPVSDVVAAAKKALYTGHIGDGKIFVYNVEQVVKIRTGETGLNALRDVE